MGSDVERGTLSQYVILSGAKDLIRDGRLMYASLNAHLGAPLMGCTMPSCAEHTLKGVLPLFPMPTDASIGA